MAQSSAKNGSYLLLVDGRTFRPNQLHAVLESCKTPFKRLKTQPQNNSPKQNPVALGIYLVGL
jgi:hypothetical protein